MGALPAIFTELEISYFLLRRLLGVRTEGDKRGAKVRGEGQARSKGEGEDGNLNNGGVVVEINAGTYVHM